eukprot:g1759.t1
MPVVSIEERFTELGNGDSLPLPPHVKHFMHLVTSGKVTSFAQIVKFVEHRFRDRTVSGPQKCKDDTLTNFKDAEENPLRNYSHMKHLYKELIAERWAARDKIVCAKKSGSLVVYSGNHTRHAFTLCRESHGDAWQQLGLECLKSFVFGVDVRRLDVA